MIITKVDTLEIVKDIIEDETRISIVTINGESYYQYQCQLEIDTLKAYASNSRMARIEVVADLVTQQFSPIDVDATNSTEAFNQLLQSIPARRFQSSEQRSNDAKTRIIYHDNVDIFKTITKTSKLKLSSNDMSDVSRVMTKFDSYTTESLGQIAFDHIKQQKEEISSIGSERLYTRLVSQGKDPGKQMIVRSLVDDPATSRRGLGSVVSGNPDKVKASFTATSDGILLLDPTTQNDQKYVVSKQETTDSILPINFNFPIASVNVTKNIYLTIIIKKDNGSIIQKKDFTIDHELYTRKTLIPQKLPSVAFKKLRDNQIVVNVFDKDPIVSGVKILQRVVKNNTTFDNQTPYQEIDTVLSVDDAGYYTKRINLTDHIVGKTFFRSVPFLKDGKILGNYETASFIAPFPAESGVIYTFFNKQSVTARLRGTPANFEYVQFTRRSITLKSKIFTKIGAPIKVVNGEVEYEDFEIKKEHVYEYSAVLYNATGETKNLASSSAIRTTNYASGASLTVQLLSSEKVDTGTLNKFNVDITLNKDTDTTQLLQNLKDLGIDNYYETEFLKLSADLKKIVKLYVRRINSKTGEVNILGLKNTGDFEDTASADSIYIFEGVIKSQADIFEELGSTLTSTKILDPSDPSQRGDIVSSVLSSNQTLGKKNFTQKFLSKKSIVRGTLSVGVTRDYQEDDSGFLSGRLGISSSIEVEALPSQIVIDNFRLEIADEKRRILQFDVSQIQNDNEIDFFIIETLRGTTRSTVGVCHFFAGQKTQSFFDNITNLKTGTVAYNITPVDYAGTPRQAVKTQTFEVI